jgi:hypothetical protein
MVKMAPTPLVTPIALHDGRMPAVEAQMEAISPDALRLGGRPIIILDAIARLYSDETPTTTMRDVARQANVVIGGALLEHLRTLRALQLVTWQDEQARTLQLTDAGWNRLGLMSPIQQTWHEGFLAGMAMKTDYTSDDDATN